MGFEGADTEKAEQKDLKLQRMSDRDLEREMMTRDRDRREAVRTDGKGKAARNRAMRRRPKWMWWKLEGRRSTRLDRKSMDRSRRR